MERRKAISESDVPEGSSGDATSSDSSDEAGDSDSDSSSGSRDASESMDSNDLLEPTSSTDDVSDGKDVERQDVDPSNSKNRDKGSESPDSESDMDAVPDSSKEEEAQDDSEVIDTGADDGTGGTSLIENEKNDHLPMGTPEECKYALLKWGDREEKPKSLEEGTSENAVDRAIIQGIYFEKPSRNILGVRFHHYGQPVMIGGSNMSRSKNFFIWIKVTFDAD